MIRHDRDSGESESRCGLFRAVIVESIRTVHDEMLRVDRANRVDDALRPCSWRVAFLHVVKVSALNGRGGRGGEGRERRRREKEEERRRKKTDSSYIPSELISSFPRCDSRIVGPRSTGVRVVVADEHLDVVLEILNNCGVCVERGSSIRCTCTGPSEEGIFTPVVAEKCQVRQFDAITLFERKHELIVVVGERHDDSKAVLIGSVDNVVVDVPVSVDVGRRGDGILRSDRHSTRKCSNRVRSHGHRDGQSFTDSFLGRWCAHRPNILVLTNPVNV